MKKVKIFVVLFILFICLNVILFNGCGGGGGGGSAPASSSGSSSSSGGNPNPSPDPTSSESWTPTDSPTATGTQTPSPTETSSPSPTQTTTPSPTATLDFRGPDGARILIDNVDIGRITPATVYKPVSIGQSINIELYLTGVGYYRELLVIIPDSENTNYYFRIDPNISDFIPFVTPTPTPTTPTPTQTTSSPTPTPMNTYIPQTQVWEKQVGSPGGVCFNASNNMIYVVGYYYGNVVEAFDTSGDFKFRFTPSTSGTPWGICCDSAGNVYVSTNDPNAPVKVFTSSGSYIKSIGAGIIGSGKGIKIENGKLYCCHTKIHVFDITTDQKLFDFGYDGNISTGEGPLEGPCWLEVTNDKVIVVDESSWVKTFDLNGIYQFSTHWNYQQGGIAEMDSNYVIFLDPGANNFVKLNKKNGELVKHITSLLFSILSDICQGEFTAGIQYFYVTDRIGNMIRKIY